MDSSYHAYQEVSVTRGVRLNNSKTKDITFRWYEVFLNLLGDPGYQTHPFTTGGLGKVNGSGRVYQILVGTWYGDFEA